MIIIDNYSKPIYIIFDYCPLINNFILDETKVNKSGLVFILISWYNSNKANKIVNSNSDYNIVILANSREEENMFKKKQIPNVLFCNHNAFINENKFYIINKNTIRQYDMVIDSAFHEYKNVKMARGIKNILHIGYFKKDEINEKYIPDFGVLPNFNNKNYKRLNKKEINDYYNQSLVGGIFSECEGACFASSQYLLAGLPVISINSVGGRDIWYNKDNSIICENLTEDSIYEALEIAKQKLQTGEFNREKIRNIHLKQMDEHRNTIINYIQDFLGNDEKVDVISIKKQMAFF
jgi:hypothetical protein